MDSRHFPRTNQLVRPSIKSSYRKTLVDASGRQFDDLVSGALVANFGYSQPRLAAIVKQYASGFPFLHGKNFESDEVRQLSTALASIDGGKSRVAYGVTGSDGIELAFRVAWLYQRKNGHIERTGIASLRPSYHGSTFAALQSSCFPAKKQFGHLHFENVSIGLTVTATERAQELELEQGAADRLAIAATTCAAFVVEPIVANSGGCYRLSAASLALIRRFCDENEIVLIYDAIATSLGRCGTLLLPPSTENPDISVVSKGLTAGFFPLSAAIIGERIHSRIFASDMHNILGHTYAAQPVAARLALEVLEMLQAPQMLLGIRQAGRSIRDQLLKCGLFGDVRAEGLLIGADFLDPNMNLKTLNDFLLGHGILVLPGECVFADGSTRKYLTLAPFFEIEDGEIDDSIRVLVARLEEFVDQSQ